MMKARFLSPVVSQFAVTVIAVGALLVSGSMIAADDNEGAALRGPGGDLEVYDVSPCGGDGIVELGDLLAMLDAYASEYACTCPAGGLWDANGNAIYNTNTGNVGIGTATPEVELDVNGATRTTTLEITGGSPLVPSAIGWGANQEGQITVPIDTMMVAAGGQHSLAIRSDGTLVGWGWNLYGQINVPSGTFIAVTAGSEHSLAIRSDGTLAGWGTNDFGETDVPVGTFVAVDAGGLHSLAIRSDGALVAWGYNGWGQNDIPSGTFIAVSDGGGHSLAIRTDGTLVGWGDSSYGQSSVPPGTFTAVSAGTGHNLAIRTDGTLVGWGRNDFGQTDVPPGAFVAIAAGQEYTLGIREDGILVGWGINDSGQVNVPNGPFTAVVAGAFHALAIRGDAPSPEPALALHADSAIKPGTNTWTIFSDRRLKKNIEPLSGALERLLQLHGVTFQWRDPATQGGITGTQMGLIADEVQRAFPQWVGRDPKGYQTLTVGGFEALTAEAMRELREEKDRQLSTKDREITDLQDRNAELESRLERTEAALARLEAVLGEAVNRKGQTP